MSFDPDAVIDRRRLKRKLRWWQAATLLAAALAIIAGLQASDLLFKRDTVARLRVTGLIVEEPRRDALLAVIAEDSSVRALIVHLDSHGGTVVGGEDLYHSLRAVSKNKPVVAVMGTVATSAAYMTAVAGDRVFAREGTITGSIGVLFKTADITGMLDKLGIKPESLKSGPLKAVPSPTEPMTGEARIATQALVLDLFDFFIDLVAERRPLGRAQVLQLADGRVYTGVNVENASFPVTICAERGALMAAIADGARRFSSMAVVTDATEPAAPCGMCRQMLVEFGLELQVLTAGRGGPSALLPLTELLPLAFVRSSFELRSLVMPALKKTVDS